MAIECVSSMCEAPGFHPLHHPRARMHTHAHVRSHSHAHILTHAHTCTYVHTRTHACARTRRAHTHVHTRTCMHAHMHKGKQADEEHIIESQRKAMSLFSVLYEHTGMSLKYFYNDHLMSISWVNKIGS